jgi:hypothetical protein
MGTYPVRGQHYEALRMTVKSSCHANSAEAETIAGRFGESGREVRSISVASSAPSKVLPSLFLSRLCFGIRSGHNAGGARQL